MSLKFESCIVIESVKRKARSSYLDHLLTVLKKRDLQPCSFLSSPFYYMNLTTSRANFGFGIHANKMLWFVI